MEKESYRVGNFDVPSWRSVANVTELIWLLTRMCKASCGGTQGAQKDLTKLGMIPGVGEFKHHEA